MRTPETGGAGFGRLMFLVSENRTLHGLCHQALLSMQDHSQYVERPFEAC